MSFMDVFNFLRGVVGRALKASKASGLTDEVVDLALQWVKVAAGKTIDNSAKRQLVVDMLVAKKIPESVARLAIELAYQLYKQNVAAKIDT